MRRLWPLRRERERKIERGAAAGGRLGRGSILKRPSVGRGAPTTREDQARAAVAPGARAGVCETRGGRWGEELTSGPGRSAAGEREARQRLLAETGPRGGKRLGSAGPAQEGEEGKSERAAGGSWASAVGREGLRAENQEGREKWILYFFSK